MADISKISVDGIEYDVKDETARAALQKATAIRVTNVTNEAVTSVIVAVSLEDGSGIFHTIKLDENDRPTQIVTKDTDDATISTVPIEWEGFE